MVTNQPRKEHTRGHMQRVARIKHRCKQHNRETNEKNKRHYVTVEREHMKCMMCAQTKPFDKVTIFLTQQCPAASQANWELRIQQLKSEMDKEQQGQVAKDLRSLMGLQANTPRQKDRNEEETPRRVVKSATGSRKPNRGSTKREIEAAQKRQERLKKRAKLQNKGLAQERDLHWIRVDEELLRCELCGKTKVLDKATVMFQQRCMSAKHEGWWETICEKLSKETNDGESDLEEAKVSRNLFDLFEQSAQTEATTAATATPEEEATTRARKEQDQQTQEKTKNQARKICNCGAKGHMVSMVPRQLRNGACGA